MRGASLNAIRTFALNEKADILVVWFGETYKQGNASFDGGKDAALGKSLIVMHQAEHQHPLNEIDGDALAVC